MRKRNRPPALRRPFLLAAFEDTEGTIRATDNKASIALIVHGFIFTGLVGILSRLGADFEQSAPCFRVLIIVLVALTAVAFLGSITQLLRCVKPAPRKAIPRAPTRGVFHLEGEAGAFSGTATTMLSLDALKQRIDGMDEAAIDVELTAELLKVSAIRARKVALAGSGLVLLGIEVVLALALLASLAIHHLYF